MHVAHERRTDGESFGCGTVKVLKRHAFALRFAMAVVTMTGCSEVEEQWYASYAEIAASGSFAPGKLFADIPVEVSAQNIHYAFDVDTNEVWISFRVPANEEFPMIGETCVPASEKMVGRPGAGPHWWPKSLSIPDSSAAQTGSRAWRKFKCKRSGWVAIDAESGDVHFYRAGS